MSRFGINQPTVLVVEDSDDTRHVLSMELRHRGCHVVTAYSAVQAATSFTQFDTAAFYLSKASASANYNLVIKAADVSPGGSSDSGDPPSITTQPFSQNVPAARTSCSAATAQRPAARPRRSWPSLGTDS
ncbi:MAG TPA: hypothetical protein VER08_10325 [Pyrinomonadaceae bacterium]|nr:hypothetical protein [Pyrinomonadaceae bacterium]